MQLKIIIFCQLLGVKKKTQGVNVKHKVSFPSGRDSCTQIKVDLNILLR